MEGKRASKASHGHLEICLFCQLWAGMSRGWQICRARSRVCVYLKEGSVSLCLPTSLSNSLQVLLVFLSSLFPDVGTKCSDWTKVHESLLANIMSISCVFLVVVPPRQILLCLLLLSSPHKHTSDLLASFLISLSPSPLGVFATSSH